jgi:hypothetical protein
MRLFTLTLWTCTAATWALGLLIPVVEYHDKTGTESSRVLVGDVYLTLAYALWDGDFMKIGVALLVLTMHCGTVAMIAMAANFVAKASRKHLPWTGLTDEHPLVVPWYDREGYGLLLEQATDGETLEPSFEAWERKATAFVEERRETGPVEKAAIDVHDLVQWCQQQGRPLDAEARSLFARHTVDKRSASP